jgi:hypothetical protein
MAMVEVDPGERPAAAVASVMVVATIVGGSAPGGAPALGYLLGFGLFLFPAYALYRAFGRKRDQ